MHHNMRLYPSPGSSPEPQTGGIDVHLRGNRSKPFFRVAEHTYRFHDQEANSNKAYYLFYFFYYTNYDHGCQWLLPPRLGLTLVSCMTTCAIPTCKPANRCQAPNRGISRFFITNKDMHSKQTCKDTFFAGLGFRSAVALRRPTSSDHAVPAWLLLSAVYKREPLRHLVALRIHLVQICLDPRVIDA